MQAFDSTCEALGVIFDLKESCNFTCKVTNTASRIEEVSLEIQRILAAGSIVVECSLLSHRFLGERVADAFPV